MNNISIQFNFSSKFNTQISNFIEEIKNYKIKTNPKLYIFLNSIAGYLILKSYNDSNKNRINHLIKNVEIKIPQINELSKKFITIDQSYSNSSRVNLSYNIEDGKLYVIKTHTDYKEKDKLSKREYNNYQNLKHPFLPQLIEYYNNKNEDCRYLVIEYIDGVTLSNFDLTNLNEFEIYNIIFEIMIVIHYIHSKNYILRDLKPDNIKIDNNNTAILIDFDRIIKVTDDDDSEFTYNFSHEYISPEISNGIKFTNKTDIYSFGLIVKNMFVERYQKFENKCLEKLEIMCKYCMKENPDDRPTISQLIRFFYLNILSYNESKSEVEKELIKILQYNFENLNTDDHEGLCTLGIIYQERIYTDMDIDEAIKYHSLAAKQNDLLSLYNLHILYFIYGDIHKAFESLKIGADLGDPFFQYKFGCCSFMHNFDVDFNECIKYLKLSAAQNFAYANFMLGFLYYTYPKMKNIEEAIKYLKNASKYQKHKSSGKKEFYDFHGTFSLPNKIFTFDYKLFNSGLLAKFCSNQYLMDIYSSENTNQYDISKSIYYYSCLSKQDIITYQNLVNECNSKYFPEKIINMLKYAINDMQNAFAFDNYFMAIFYNKNNIGICIENLEFLLDFNNFLAPFLLGKIYSNNELNCINLSKAMEYFSLAEKMIDFYEYNPPYFIKLYPFIINNTNYTNQNNKDIIKIIKGGILNSLGDIYYNGKFTQRDMNKAIHFFSQASEYEDSVAQYKLGRIYYDGEYIKENIEKSIHYLTLSAKSKNRDSQFLLGLIYYEGKKVLKDIKKAIKYFKEASENLSRIARFYLGIIYYTGTDIKRDIELSIYYFKEAANLNDSYAKNNLGIIYKNEEEIKQNITQSIEYFEESICFDNNEAARYNLAHIYFYDDRIKNEINKTIELLIKPEIISIDYGHQLLCLALIEECKSISVKSIKDIFIKVYPNCDRSIALDIYNEIKNNDLLNENKYSELFKQIEKIELIYINHVTFMPTKDLNIIKPLSANIDIDFYEGFDDDELIEKYQIENPNSIKRKNNAKPRKYFIKREHFINQARNINIKTNQIKNKIKSMNDNNSSNIDEAKFTKIFNKYEEDDDSKQLKK